MDEPFSEVRLSAVGKETPDKREREDFGKGIFTKYRRKRSEQEHNHDKEDRP